MARGFGNILGAGSTDIVVTSLTSHSTLRSYHIRTYRHGDGGNSLGRIFEKTNGGGATVALLNVDPDYRFSFARVGLAGEWNITRPSADVWHGLGLSYDAGSTANDPVFYVDGASVTVTESSAPSGSPLTSTDPVTIGNRQSDAARNWDGMLAEAAIWDEILTADEFRALGLGLVSALSVRPQSLVCYVPMVNNLLDLRRGGVPSVTGTVVQPHPRIFNPLRPMGLDYSSASAGTLKTWQGLATANIKTFQGLAKASTKTVNGLTP